MKLIPIVLCGGAGSRLWPVSRELHPKPFIRLADGQSLLQKAWLRGANLAETADIVTVTNRELFFKSIDEYREVADTINIEISNSFILEPFGRNTAAAIAAAALHVAEVHGEDALLLVLAADHLITDQNAFSLAVMRAKNLAAQGKLVTFGIEPEGPETGFGYIESQGEIALRFVEKPGIEKAREYFNSDRYLWNSGMFCFSARTLLREMASHCPSILAATQTCIALSRKATGLNLTQIELDSTSFNQVPDESIDYALMEKSQNVAVVRCSIGWSDIGSWNALGDLIEPDKLGNRVEGEVLLHDVHDCYIRSGERIVAGVGINNLIVIDTPDALLVASRDRAQDVKHLYSSLKAQDNCTHKLHRTVHRPWGTYTILEEGPRFKIKRIEVKPGASLSLQTHRHRSEQWVVVSGKAQVVNGDKTLLVHTDESTYIAAGHKHRLENVGEITLVMIEVQSGDYLGEDDIIRFEDVYGRQ